MNVLREKTALEILKNHQCTKVNSIEEGEIIIKMLESSLIDAHTDYVSLTAPQLNVMRQVAIIRTDDTSIDLINPVIIDFKDKIISFKERCLSFPANCVNCFRWNEITIKNGIVGIEKKFTGKLATLVQHAIDHLNGIVFYDRAIKLAIVREDGIIKDIDYCPCGSKERFSKCCMRK